MKLQTNASQGAVPKRSVESIHLCESRLAGVFSRPELCCLFSQEICCLSGQQAFCFLATEDPRLLDFPKNRHSKQQQQKEIFVCLFLENANKTYGDS
jgi:hypothetical protein